MADSAKELVEFLTKYQWTWQVKLTRFFADNYWQQIPIEWRKVLSVMSTDELTVLPDSEAKPEWPECLKDFIVGCRTHTVISPPLSVVRENRLQLDGEVRRGMTPQKQHEVCSLAGYVNHLCRDEGCTAVVDIGSGLGYLGLCLSQQCGLHVTGVEREIERVRTALKRSHTIQKRQGKAIASKKPSSSPGMFSCVQLDLNSSSESRSVVQHMLEDTLGRICLVGLHCCGDLTTSLLSLYAEHQAASGLHCMVIVPCCYHKLSLSHDGKWIPLSRTVKDILCSAKCALNACALRLAAQDSYQRKQAKNLILQCRHVTFRGILECVAVTENMLIERKLVRKANPDSFESYVSHILQKQQPGADVVALRSKLYAEYSRQQHVQELVQSFLALQACVQRVLESLLLMDYVLFLREESVSAQLVALFEESVSPRCMGIMAR